MNKKQNETKPGSRMGEEEIGNLEQMLQQIALQMNKEAAIMSKVRGALTYPAFVLAVAAVAVIALITFVVPMVFNLKSSSI